MCFGVAEDFDGREERAREGCCPPSVLAVVVRLGRAERVAFGAELATHTERQNRTADVALAHIVALFFDVGLLVAVLRAVRFSSACSSLFGEVVVSAEARVALVQARA